MFNAALRHTLATLLLLTAPAILQANDTAAPQRPTQNASTVLSDLDKRLDKLQQQLNVVRDARGEAQRQNAMEAHWQTLQRYMAASLGVAVADPKPSDPANCEVISASWRGLPFPGQIRSDDYLKSMQSQLGKMRENLIDLHAARGADALNASLQAHWQANYRFLQELRGLDWMFASWNPANPGDQTLPAPQSEGAELTKAYCANCHAVPSSRMHTAEEWNAVMTTMSQHITTSDSNIPICVQIPTAEELQAINAYLVQYAR